MFYDSFPRGTVLDHISVDIQVLPHYQSLHSSHFKSFQGVIDTKDIFPCILTDLLKILAN
uniref:Eukaryotic peptide chain release factor subunit 1-1 n=1 Tax=Arundo donax TaxID=35708 RepID=A0A0A9E6F9_ARUDO